MSGIESIMNRDVVTIGLDATVRDAAKTMREHGLGALIVVKDDRIHGIVSERDVMNRVVAEGLDPAATDVASVCTANPVTVLETESVEQCFHLLREQGFRHLPIRNEANEPIGIVSARDFMWGLLMTAERSTDIDEVCRQLGKVGNVLEAFSDPRYDVS